MCGLSWCRPPRARRRAGVSKKAIIFGFLQSVSDRKASLDRKASPDRKASRLSSSPLAGRSFFFKASRRDLERDGSRRHNLCVPCLPRARPQQRSLLLIPFHPTQSVMYLPLQVNRFAESILLIVQYRYSKSCSGDSSLLSRI